MENNRENGRTNRNSRANNHSNAQTKFVIPNPKLPPKLKNSNYVDTAELVVLHLKGKEGEKRFIRDGNEWKLVDKSKLPQKLKFHLTTTKIRNLLSLLNVIQQMVLEGEEVKINETTLGKIQYFKMRCAYEAGREPAVRDFIKKSNLMNYIDHIGDSKKEFELFFHYVEALVAYHRYYGGDN